MHATMAPLTLARIATQRTASQLGGSFLRRTSLALRCRQFHSSSWLQRAAVVEWGYGHKTLSNMDMSADATQGPHRTRIAAGASHRLISFSGEDETGILALGMNHSGQLGVGITSEDSSAHTIDTQGLNVVALACGREHSMLLAKVDATRLSTKSSDKTYLFGFGNSMYGQLGLGRSKDVLDAKEEMLQIQREAARFVFDSAPRVIELPDRNENVAQVECGLDHTVILTDQCNLYSMGWGADGQLGLGPESSSDRVVPTLIERLSWKANGKKIGRVKKISSSTDFTLALLENHQLWIWGNAEYGQCMVNKKIDRILEPMHIPHPIPETETITSVAAGGTFGLLLTKSGKVYTCGYGALGLGRDKIHVLMPEQIPSLSGIQKIFASTDYAAAIDDKGDLYTWGTCGRTGRLGHGDYGDCFEPRKVTMPLEEGSGKAVVHDVALGQDGALALVEYDEQ